MKTSKNPKLSMQQMRMDTKRQQLKKAPLKSQELLNPHPKQDRMIHNPQKSLSQLINIIMFVQRSQAQQSPLRKQLKLIADLAHYQPIPSIPQPSLGFNYTLSRQRYSEYQTPRVIPKHHKPYPVHSQDLKLATILETQNSNHLFPRIAHPVRKQSPNFKKVQRLPTYFSKERQQTEATRERSLTFDTPNTNQEDRLNSIEHRTYQQPFQTYQKQSSVSYRNMVASPQQSKQLREQQTMIVHRQSEESSEDDQDEFEKNAVPGPGTYSYSYSDFDKKSFSKSTKASSFISQSTRFPQLKQIAQVEPQRLQNPLEIEKEKRRQQRMMLKKSKKRIAPFNSLSPRVFQSDQTAKVKGPGPEDYSPRFGIEQQLIKKIQRHFKGNFGSNEQRFRPPQPNPYLGPAFYTPISPSSPQPAGNFFFKSNQSRF